MASLDSVTDPLVSGSTGNVANVTELLETSLVKAIRLGGVQLPITSWGNNAQTQSFPPTIIQPISAPNTGDEFTESFETSPLASPWYDQAEISGFAVGTNPDDGSNCYRYEWTSGQSAAPLSQTARRIIDPTDILNLRCSMWGDSALVGQNGDHFLYAKLNTADAYAGLAVGTGFTFYLQPRADGQYHLDWRLSDDTTWDSEVTIGAPSFYGTTPRDVQVIATMNTVGQSDGTLELFVDGTSYINKTDCVFRQASNEQFGQIIVGPYVGSVQTATANMYLDDLVVKSVDSGNETMPSATGTAQEFFALLNTDANPVDAIWASSQVADGNGTGTNADPLSLRGAVYSAGLGDTVLLKDDGDYALSNPMNLASDYDDTNGVASFNGAPTGGTAWGGGNLKVVTMNTAKPTQESERITIRGEQGSCPTVDCQGMRFITLENNPYMTFGGIDLQNTRDGIVIYDSCHYPIIENFNAKMTVGGSNLAPILVTGLTENGIVRRFHIEGPGQAVDGINSNCAGFYIRRNNDWDVSHGTIHNFPAGIYFKHPNDPADVSNDVQGVFENVHVYDTDRDFGNSFSGNGWTFRNCLLNGIKFGATGGTGANGIAEGGFDMKLVNTTFRGKVEFTGAALATGGSNNPDIDGCVFGERLDGHPYDVGTAFNAVSDYNLFSQDSFRINDVFLTFSQWQTQESADANSIQATPSFVGSDASIPAHWALTGGSSGTNADRLGNDIGCDVTTVGYGGNA